MSGISRDNVYLEVIPDRSVETLVGLLGILCEEGCTIVSDALADCEELRRDFHHFAVQPRS